MKGKNILELLGVKKGSPRPNTSKDGTARKEPVCVDEASINSRYNGFDRMFADIADFPEYGRKLLDAIMASEALFGRFICNVRYLQKIVLLCPTKIDVCVDNVLTIPESYDRFLTSFNRLLEIVELEEFKLYKDKLLTRALTHSPIYLRLLTSSNSVERGLKYFPEYQTMILDILAKDPIIFEKCIDSAKHFCAFSKAHPTYTDRFLQHLINSDAVNDKAILVTQLPYVMEQFPAYQDRIIDFIMADDKRFERLFPGLNFIYDFCEKFPQYLEKLYGKALTVDNYMRSEVTVPSDLFRIFDRHPKHAKQIESLIIADPRWVLEMLSLPAEFKKVCQHGSFEALKAAFLENIYLNPKQFTSLHVSDQAHLDNMIALAPEQAKKLTLYFQLLTQKKPVADIIKAEYLDAQTMSELTLYIMRSVKDRTMTVDTIKSLREQVAGILDFTEDNAPHFAALSDLNAYLNFSLTPKVTELLSKSMLKGEKAHSATDSTPAAQPNTPGGTKSN